MSPLLIPIVPTLEFVMWSIARSWESRGTPASRLIPGSVSSSLNAAAEMPVSSATRLQLTVPVRYVSITSDAGRRRNSSQAAP